VSSILIIDDDVTLLARLTAQLEEAGFEVARSSDLGHGERLYAEHRPDLVILEVRSGGNAGWELLGRLAAETPVVVLSGAASENDVVRGMEAGAVDYIAKPYRSAELVARLRARLAVPVAAAAPPAPPAPAVAVAAKAAAAPPAPASSQKLSARTRPARARNGREDEESVFMSEAEEMALLRLPPADAPAPKPARQPEDEGPQSFGQRLRAERQRRHLTLVQLENDLRIRMSYLQAMEDEKFTLLPRGPAALQMVRTYAEHLGLDANAAVEEFRSQYYAEESEPIPALGGSPLARPMPRWLIPLAAALLALALCVGAILIFDPSFFARVGEFFAALWGQVFGG
jgi:DNA-binding response OmpR family regulator